jgi:hypothetical protein
MLFLHTGPQFYKENLHHRWSGIEAKNFGVVQQEKRQSNQMLYVGIITKIWLNKELS